MDEKRIIKELQKESKKAVKSYDWSNGFNGWDTSSNNILVVLPKSRRVNNKVYQKLTVPHNIQPKELITKAIDNWTFNKIKNIVPNRPAHAGNLFSLIRNSLKKPQNVRSIRKTSKKHLRKVMHIRSYSALARSKTPSTKSSHLKL